jgi:hypothetical protein
MESVKLKLKDDFRMTYESRYLFCFQSAEGTPDPRLQHVKNAQVPWRSVDSSRHPGISVLSHTRLVIQPE